MGVQEPCRGPLRARKVRLSFLSSDFRQAPNIVRALQCELAFLGRVFGCKPADDVPMLVIDNDAALPPAAG